MTGLDPIRSEVINELINKLQKELNITSIVVTHDLRSAFSIADHMVMLYDGSVVMQGRPEEFREAQDPVVQRFLEGRATVHPIAAEGPDQQLRLKKGSQDAELG